MIPILVLRASASSIIWEVRITALDFYLEMPETTDHINRRASGSIPEEGSSKRIIGGLPIIAIPTDNLRLFPPERSPDAFDL